MALDRLKQVLARTEVNPAVALSPLSATYGKHLVIEPTVQRIVKKHARNLSRDTLTKAHSLVSLRSARLSFGIELAGQQVATPDVPTWDIFMQACGYKSVATRRLGCGAITSGPFRHGETITFSGTGGTGTAIVAHDTYSGAPYLYFHTTSAGFTVGTSSTVTGGTSGATMTPTVDDTDAGQSWYPVSKHTSQISYTGGGTTEFPVGTPIKGATSGARAMVTAVTVTSGTWAGGTAAGVITFRYYSGTFQSGEEIQNATNTAHNCDSSSAASQVDIPSISLGFIEDGKFDYIYGARGNVRIDAKIGEPVMLMFEFLGSLNAPSSGIDQPLVTGVAYESQIPPLFVGTAMKLGNEGDANTTSEYTPRISNIQVSLNNELTLRENAAVADGYEDCVIVDRSPGGSFDPELDLEASYPFFQHAFGASSVPLGRCNFSVGSTAGNAFYASLPGMLFDPAQTQSRGKVLAYQIPFDATGGYHSTETAATIGSDNELCLTYLIV